MSPAILFVIVFIGGFCGLLSGIDNIKNGKDGTFWFLLGALNFMFAGNEFGNL